MLPRNRPRPNTRRDPHTRRTVDRSRRVRFRGHHRAGSRRPTRQSIQHRRVVVVGRRCIGVVNGPGSPCDLREVGHADQPRRRAARVVAEASQPGAQPRRDGRALGRAAGRGVSSRQTAAGDEAEPRGEEAARRRQEEAWAGEEGAGEGSGGRSEWVCPPTHARTPSFLVTIRDSLGAPMCTSRESWNRPPSADGSFSRLAESLLHRTEGSRGL